MTECKRCSRKTDLFLCSTCVGNLRQKLHDLPWWLDRLMETSLGQARMGDQGRRSKRRNVLHGDDSIASHIEPFPRDSDRPATKGDHEARRRAALRHALSAVRVNTRASDELQRIHNTLTRWVKDLCETRGLELPQLNTAAAMAKWLERHAASVAHQEDATILCDDVEDMTRNAERIVNRPVPPMIIGPCVTDPAPDEVLAKRIEAGDRETRCNRALEANKGATEVTCTQCKEVHDVEEVLAQNLDALDDQIFTVRDLVDWVLPRLDEAVPQRTLERWILGSQIEVRGFSASGAQMVLLGDVRKVRASRPRHGRKAG